MNFNFCENREMITEELINKTIEWYEDNNIAYFRKAHLPISTKIFDKNVLKEVNIEKADIDYYGICKGKYVAFEVKEIKKDFFIMDNLKPHKFYILKTIYKHGGYTFLLLNFLEHEDSIWMIDFERIQQIQNNKIKKINSDEVKNFGIKLNIEYPGVIDWIKQIL